MNPLHTYMITISPATDRPCIINKLKLILWLLQLKHDAAAKHKIIFNRSR
jgi:hypothetical protein